MIKKIDNENIKKEDLDDFNDYCDECKTADESVKQNLVLIGYKICKSCRVSKTIFPI